MCSDIYTYVHEVTMCTYAVIQEESSPIQTSDNSSESTDTSAIVRSKHAIVSGKKKGRPANCPTMMKKASSQTECDSGYPVSTPDKMPTDVENMFEQPPGSFTAGVLPRLLNSGANVNFIPEGPQEGDVEDTTAPVPTSPSGSITTEAQQPRLDAADDPPSGAAFTIGPSLETVQAESDEIGEQVATTSSPMTATLHLSQSAKELAAKILSTDIINELDQIDELREENEKLKRQLKEEMDKREALRQEKEELNDQFTNYQKSVMEKEEADKTKLLEKEKQLEECRKRISEMELEHKTTCAALEAEIASLKQKMDDEKKKTELEMLRLENKLYKAEKELADKENVILVKEKEIEVLDKKIALDSKDAEIQKLKNENKALRRGQSLSRSLSSLRVSEEDDNSANPE